jgi:rhodanese-related sulfurtransferase
LNHLRADKSTFVREIELAGFEVAEERDFLETSYWIRFKKSDRKTDSKHTTDSVDDIKRSLADGTAKLIDVREEGEWDAGHLAAADLVPLSTLRSLPADQLGTKLVDKLPKDKIIYCHCRSGGRVLAATLILEQLGYDIRPLALGYSALVDEGFQQAK